MERRVEPLAIGRVTDQEYVILHLSLSPSHLSLTSLAFVLVSMSTSRRKYGRRLRKKIRIERARIFTCHQILFYIRRNHLSTLRIDVHITDNTSILYAFQSIQLVFFRHGYDPLSSNHSGRVRFTNRRIALLKPAKTLRLVRWRFIIRHSALAESFF
ncbi:hypothetical protein L228DRAFT_180581 [Xylona heveae TC161]|uniref:Uncharacterized protein n=1 Tax=Xylona heveae (strain CBS 132557 / TC161) TaxID=1328760 RepID=A0A165FD78_XYLHT|nr:hypothetical protein L228DRAFT_180581 [Xylona heveae TC161]KZF20848.1 hypothetical protein L228DRAFT_180581 [Xylona heveae TC161]